MTPRIIASRVTLEVPHYVQAERSAKSMFATLLAAATSRARREYRMLLDDISLDAREGDRIALLGRNGAGKTTLLRVLSGAFQPTQGKVELRGSHQALLNIGLGFNQHATVKENVYLRAIAMGMHASQIRDLVEPILAFAELGEAINHRLFTLSSGQRMRLGFSISTALQHDIMLLDEWLGAGDAAFVEKAKARMSDRVDGSKIVVLASHNFQMLRKVCNRGLVLDHGKIVHAGEIDDAIAEYKKIYESTPQYVAARKVEPAAAARSAPDAQRKRILDVDTQVAAAARKRKAAVSALDSKAAYAARVAKMSPEAQAVIAARQRKAALGSDPEAVRADMIAKMTPAAQAVIAARKRKAAPPEEAARAEDPPPGERSKT